MTNEQSMGTPAPFGPIYSSGSRHILIAGCWDIAMGVCCVPIHHQTGTDIAGSGRLAETNQSLPPGHTSGSSAASTQAVLSTGRAAETTSQ